MVTFTQRLVLVAMLILVAGSFTIAQAAPVQQHPVTTDDLQITLGDGWQTNAKFSYPANVTGRLPTVILVHGGGPKDTEHTIADPATGQVISTNFKTIADSFSANGLAVLRFNKRYVTDAATVDNSKFAQLTLADQLSDVEAVLQAAKANPRVDASRIFVYAWSEGTLIAAALAAKHPELVGVILQGAIASTERQTFIEDYSYVLLPYLRTFAPDGQITSEVLTKALAGDGGVFVKGIMFDLIDLSVTDSLKVSPFFDNNGDSVLDLAAEVTPKLGDWVDQQLAPGGLLAFAGQLPSVSEQATNIRVPVLVLQGENDVVTRIKNLPQLESALTSNSAASVRRYSGLGHGLEPTNSIFTDNFGPIATQPLADAVTWINGLATTPRILPITGEEASIVVTWIIILALVLVACGIVIRRQRLLM